MPCTPSEVHGIPKSPDWAFLEPADIWESVRTVSAHADVSQHVVLHSGSIVHQCEGTPNAIAAILDDVAVLEAQCTPIFQDAGAVAGGVLSNNRFGHGCDCVLSLVQRQPSAAILA